MSVDNENSGVSGHRVTDNALAVSGVAADGDILLWCYFGATRRDV